MICVGLSREILAWRGGHFMLEVSYPHTQRMTNSCVQFYLLDLLFQVQGSFVEVHVTNRSKNKQG